MKLDISYYKYCLEESKRDWNNATQKFKDIDQKAQATATLAGVFIAAVFAALQNTTARSNIITLYMLIASILFLSISILLALHTMRMRFFISSPNGLYIMKLIKDMSVAVSNGRDSTELEIGFYIEQIHKWHKSTEAILIINNRKAKSAEAAQWLLFIAIMIITSDIALSLPK